MLPTARQTVSEFLAALTKDDKALLETYRPLAHRHIVITGKLDGGLVRETLTMALTKWGAVTDDRVYPSTDYLLAVDPDRMTTKRKEAARFGVTVLDEHGFTRMLTDAIAQAEDERERLAEFSTATPPPPPSWFAADPDLLPDGIGEDEDDPDFEDTIAPLSAPGA